MAPDGREILELITENPTAYLMGAMNGFIVFVIAAVLIWVLGNPRKSESLNATLEQTLNQMKEKMASDAANAKRIEQQGDLHTLWLLGQLSREYTEDADTWQRLKEDYAVRLVEMTRVKNKKPTSEEGYNCGPYTEP